ncbi:hypothetical protein B296_00031927 [Ensete ventricosum]|uniref:Uncharacterized protein n=1 Tax=Ensete ventricosum TaxID=4639 RepID=A0A427AEW9_ENSVE|nr:hypothetical protein B296_00031927 [Ensete ventricosum]
MDYAGSLRSPFQHQASNLHLVCSDSQHLDLPLVAVTLIKQRTRFSQMLFPARCAEAFSQITLLRGVDFMQIPSYQLEMQEQGTMIEIKTGILTLSAPTIRLWTFTTDTPPHEAY